MSVPRRIASRNLKKRGSIPGTLLGILVFLIGVALLGLTFKLAIDMFGQEPAKLFGLKSGEEIDLNNVLAQLAGVVVRVLLLLVMAVIGGLIANRGIKLFADSRWGHPPEKRRREKTEAAATEG